MKVIPILPRKNPIPVDKLMKAHLNAFRATAKAIQTDFNVTTQTWKNRPDFVIEDNGSFDRSIYTTDKIYGYVNYGTRPHKIRAKNAKTLAFPSQFSPKTVPQKIMSRPGKSGGPTVFTQEVNHPGTEPRLFTRTIVNKWRKEWPIQMQRAINAVAT